MGNRYDAEVGRSAIVLSMRHTVTMRETRLTCLPVLYSVYCVLDVTRASEMGELWGMLRDVLEGFMGSTFKEMYMTDDWVLHWYR